MLSITNNIQAYLFDPKMKHLQIQKPGSNGNEEALSISQKSKTGASPIDAVLCHTQGTCFLEGSYSCDTFGIF